MLSRRVLLVGNRKTRGLCTPLFGNFTTLRLSFIITTIFPLPLPLPPPPAAVSARKLAASLWEFHRYPPHYKMHRDGVNNTNGRYHQRHHHQNKAVDFSHFLADPRPNSDPDQPESSSSLRRHIAQTLMKHHRSIGNNNHVLQPVSPASYGSSMEVAPYNPAVTPSSSVCFRGRIGESHYNLKTSTELLKVLNHIWSLEEQHASNISLIKALKKELDHARVRIKDLLRDQQACRREIDGLMKQIAEDKLVWKSKEQDRVHAAGKEIKEALENLCDEFAKGIKSYEQEVHTLRQKSNEDWTGVADHDRLILHISESWLDERAQIKLEEAQSGFSEQNSTVDRLGFEIEAFLQAKHIGSSVSKCTDYLSRKDRRKSLESIPLNEAVSASKDVCDEEDSDSNHSNCFELNKPSSAGMNSHEDEALICDGEELMKSNHVEKKLSSHEKIKSRHPSGLQVKSEEKMARATTTQYSNKGRKNKLDEIHGLSSNYVPDNLIRNHTTLSEGRNMNEENDCGEASCSYAPWRNQPSPVRQWMTKITPQMDLSKSSSKLPPATKDHSLKAKLLEARSKGQRSRLKIFKGKS
ncbi:cation/H(+) antiporter 18-like isoform X1 [Hibiscus syriacus]|uniref:Cation/H(+) antiporter 18-like isoform X1 n=1 Tax=Hibiscus syriacus TaxID=106335 RepID=A0A6A2X8B0_HIBSY|nr:cation/H(+) antiporter 18-like isoform X1 [Hibiscus syriacus]